MNSQRRRTLALYPHRRGLSYVLIDDLRRLRDFGRKWISRNKSGLTLQYASELVRDKCADRVVLEDAHHYSCRRRHELRRLIDSMRTGIRRMSVELATVGNARMVSAFDARDCSNKNDRAILIAHLYPQLRDRLPSRREPWEAESELMGVFDAMMLALTIEGIPDVEPENELERLQRCV